MDRFTGSRGSAQPLRTIGKLSGHGGNDQDGNSGDWKLNMAVLKQGWTTQKSWRDKFFLQYPRAQINIFLPIQRVFLSNKQVEYTFFLVLRAELKASAGHTFGPRAICSVCLL